MAREKAEVEQATVKQAIEVTSFDNFPELDSREWKFVRGDNVYVLKYVPLSNEDQEEVNAQYPMPVPPMKEITDEKELIKRRSLKLPTSEPDPDDPEYQKAVEKASSTRGLAYVQRAFIKANPNASGWDMPLDEFEKKLRRLLVTGEVFDLIAEVSKASYRVDPAKVDAFFLN